MDDMGGTYEGGRAWNQLLLKTDAFRLIAFCAGRSRPLLALECFVYSITARHRQSISKLFRAQACGVDELR
jgi:hypothetical protein